MGKLVDKVVKEEEEHVRTSKVTGLIDAWLGFQILKFQLKDQRTKMQDARDGSSKLERGRNLKSGKWMVKEEGRERGRRRGWGYLYLWGKEGGVPRSLVSRISPYQNEMPFDLNH